jgi:hypothetical protein
VRIAALAEAQGGVVARRQLLAVGLSSASIARHVAGGRLHTVARGVYAVGHGLVGADGRRWAAVLALGPGAVVSHGTAADAWDIRPSASGLVQVTVGRGGRARRPGVRLHRVALAADEATTLSGLPITTPSRTLLDMAGSGLRGRPLEAALDRAERLRALDFADLGALLDRYPDRRGSRALRTALDRYVPGSIETLSILEELVLGLCDRHGIPRPLVNAAVLGRRRDFHWPDRRLVVEADSYAWHRSPSALSDDRERDVELTLNGYTVLRFTYEQVTKRRRYVVSALRRALAGRVSLAQR